MKRVRVRAYKTINVDVEVDEMVNLTDEEIAEALIESGQLEEIEHLLSLSKQSSIIDDMKREIALKIAEKASLEQLEDFLQTL